MIPGIIKKLYHTTAVGLTDESKREVYPITATPAVYSPAGALSFPDRRLDQIIDSLNEGYQYVGLATPSTNPGTYDHKVFYLACEPGTYPYFGGIVVSGLTVIRNTNSGWAADAMNITSGGGGSLGTGYIGTTPTQALPSLQDLTGITNIVLESNARIYFGNSSAAPYIEFDQYGFHFSHGLYSDSFVSAGGISSSGGGGGGISVESDPIFTAHIAHTITASDIANWNSKTSNIGTVTSINLVEGTGITISDSGTAITSSGSRTIALSQAYQNKISTLESYFTNGVANNAAQLNGHPDTYFATASGLDALTTRVLNVEDWFEIVDGNLHVRHGRGLYSDSFISAGGLSSSSGGGGGGVSYLKLLEDVYHSSEVLRANGTTAVNGDFLAYDTSQISPVRWVAKPINQSFIISALGYTPYNASNPNGYGTITSITMNNRTWTTGAVDLGNVVTDAEIEDLWDAIDAIDWLIVESYTEGGVAKKRLKVNPIYEGLYSNGFISAGGIGDSQGSGGGVSYLKQLSDVKHSTGSSGTVLRADGTPVQNGDTLVYDSTNLRWQAASNFAIDANVVHTSGNEIIGGNKTFDSTASIDFANSGLTLDDLLYEKLDVDDFRFDIICKSNLPNSTDLNTIYDKTLSNLNSKFTYYAYVGNTSNNTAGINGFPASSNANALLNIGTYSDSSSQYLYQVGFSSNGEIYFRNGIGEKTNNTWGAAFNNQGYWNKIMALDHTNKWYPDKINYPNSYVEWNGQNGTFYFHGNIIADGYITAGASA